MDGTTPIASQPAARAPAQHHAIEIERLPRAPTSGIQRYRVVHAGIELLASTRDPEFEACRNLVALGHTGTLTTYGKGDATPRMTIGIERGSTMRTAEGVNSGPRLGVWRPFEAFGDDDTDAAVEQCGLPL